MSEDINTTPTTDEVSPDVVRGNGNANNQPLDLEAAELGAPDDESPPNDDDTTATATAMELSELDAIESDALLDEELQIEFPDTTIAETSASTTSDLPVEERIGAGDFVTAEPPSELAPLAQETYLAPAPAVASPPSEPPAPPPTAGGRRRRRPRRDPNEMEFWDHLEELRERIFKVLLFATLGMAVCWTWRGKVLDILQAPLTVQKKYVIVGPSNDPAGVRKATSAADAFQRIANGRHLFVSARTNDDKMQQKEMCLWTQAKVTPQREGPSESPPLRLPSLPRSPSSSGQPRSPAEEIADLRQQINQLKNLFQQLLVSLQAQKPPTPWYEERYEDADKVLRYANNHKAYMLVDELSYNLQRKKIKLQVLYDSDPILLGEKDIILKPYSPSLFGWFLINVEVSLLAGLIVAAPFILYQIWAFVVPALTPTEKRYALRVIPFSILLFVAGVAFGFYALPVAVKFLVSFVPDQAERLLDFKLYFGFLLKICLGLGLCFQLPLVMLFLAAIGLVSPSFLTSHWRHAVVVMFTIAAVITPTWDPVNMGIVAAPLVALYFLSIVLVKWMVRKREREAEATNDGWD